MQHNEDVTLAMIMERLQLLQNDMNRRFDEVDRRFDAVESNAKRMERNLTAQIGAIDERLDTIEIEQLPKRVLRLEEAVLPSR